MGLDMFLYKVKKMTKEGIKNLPKRRDEFPPNYIVIRKQVAKDEEDMVKDIIPYCESMKVSFDYMDFSKCLEDYHIDKDDLCICEGHFNDSVKYNFKSGREIILSRDEYNNYLYEKEEDCYVCKCDNIAYWRKNYDLEDKIYDAYDGIIENCGFYRINKEDAYELFKDSNLDEIEDDEAFIYHEWY